MREFDKLILENFAKYCDKKKIDIHDHTNIRLAAQAYCSEIATTVINFVEWSIEDDCNNNFSEYVNAEDTGEGADNGTGL